MATPPAADREYAFGLSEFTTNPWPFERDVERYAAHGLDTIEVVEAKLDENRLEEQFASIREAGLGISGLQPKVRTFFNSRMTPDPKPLDERVKALRGSIERLGRYAPGVPFITNTGAHPKDGVTGDRSPAS